jgi:hypothetical protein
MGARFEPAGTLRFHPTRSGRWPGHWNTLAKIHRRMDFGQACFRLKRMRGKLAISKNETVSAVFDASAERGWGTALTSIRCRRRLLGSLT